jgi:hypothetical protein
LTSVCEAHFQIEQTVLRRRPAMGGGKMNMNLTRNRNAKSNGGGFDGATVQAVWQKGRAVPGYDPAHWRVDACGAWMQFSEYGTASDLGWEVDHIKPVARGGSDDLSNLQPLHWQNNRHKADDWPNWTCAVQG